MARINQSPQPIRTHEGAPAVRINAEQQLRRTVLSCLLWEDTFYESGKSIADRIVECADNVSTTVLMDLAVEARTRFNLRHVPLMLLIAMCKRGGQGIAQAICDTIQRPDEMMELLAIYWKDGKKPLPKQMQKGLAKAFCKFNEYSLAKYNRDTAIKLRDVMFMCHPKPADDAQAALFKRVAENTLVTPDTWEVALSGGADKKATFTRLIQEGKLGYLALLRNLRNMEQAGVDRELISNTIRAKGHGADRVLPFRYVAAARACPSMEPALDFALCDTINRLPKLKGRTIVLVDVSGSMDTMLSGKSDMKRIDAAACLASMINADDIRIVTFSQKNVEVPPRRGMAGVDTIIRSQVHGSTNLREAVQHANSIPHDRLIVITDEQASSPVPNPVCENAYMINVASYRNGIGYGPWTHIDGFSENVLTYINELESAQFGDVG